MKSTVETSKLMKTAVYCRLAQKDDARIEEQQKRVLQYAEEQGFRNVTLYVDNGTSGLTFNRPAFTQMNADIAVGRIKAVVVRSIDRIGRDYGLVNSWFDEMKRRSITVKAIDGSCDNDTSLMIDLIRNINTMTCNAG